MHLTDEQLSTLRAALIAGRLAYCADMVEHGADGMQKPEPSIKAAMEMLGMVWVADELTMFHEDAWVGNEQFRPPQS